MRRLILGTALLLIAGCNETPTDTQDAVVNLLGQTFDPATVNLDAGAEVTWVNNNSIEHNITPRNHTYWEARTLTTTGERFSVKFDAPGTYEYECTIHPGMEGVVNVTS